MILMIHEYDLISYPMVNFFSIFRFEDLLKEEFFHSSILIIITNYNIFNNNIFIYHLLGLNKTNLKIMNLN